jgi:hypothetical protein
MSSPKLFHLAIQTLNEHLWLNVSRDLYAKLTSAYMEHELTATAES